MKRNMADYPTSTRLLPVQYPMIDPMFPEKCGHDLEDFFRVIPFIFMEWLQLPTNMRKTCPEFTDWVKSSTMEDMSQYMQERKMKKQEKCIQKR